jgi:cytochrome c oxidase assembly protein subunit 15
MAIPKLKTIAGIALVVLTFSDFFRSLDKYKLCLFGLCRFSNLSGNLYARNGLQKWFNLNQEVGPNYLYGLLDNPSRVAIHYSHRVSAILVACGFFNSYFKTLVFQRCSTCINNWNSFY